VHGASSDKALEVRAWIPTFYLSLLNHRSYFLFPLPAGSSSRPSMPRTRITLQKSTQHHLLPTPTCFPTRDISESVAGVKQRQICHNSYQNNIHTIISYSSRKIWAIRITKWHCQRVCLPSISSSGETIACPTTSA
jgi:hypothetical protein